MKKRKTAIREIEPEQADAIIDTREPLGLFYVRLSGIYLAIDNKNGNAWTESFNSLRQCKQWLKNQSVKVEVVT